MKIKHVVEKLYQLIEDLKQFDSELPAGIMFDAPHICCGNGDGYCYSSGEEVEIYDLTVSRDERYNRKLKKQVLQKVWVKGS